jgi:predicted DCC family thiol-disulfide oxidoreductase YuxK
LTPPASPPACAPQPLTVLYDGSCPLCRREIAVYRGLQPLQPGAPVCFADVSDAALPVPPGTTRPQLLARFHVRRGDGELLSGAAAFLAFLALWAALPGWRWLAWLGRVPGAAWTMERGYRVFLRWRPALQRWAARIERRGAHDAAAPSPPAPPRHPTEGAQP